MNISSLRSFIAIVDHGTFTEAARALGISQPAVTVHIQTLESDLGVTLFERRYRRVTITEAGQALVPHARRVLRDLEAAKTEMSSLTDRVTGRLNLAVSTTPGQYIVPRMLGPFLRQYPEVTVTLRVYDTADVIEHVESGSAQLGMTGARVPGSRVGYEPMGSDELIVVCAPDSPLAGAAPRPLADIASEPFIVRESGSGTRMVFEEALRAAGVDPGDLFVVMELGTSEAIVSAVEGGMGVGVVSRWVADKSIRLGTVAEVAVFDFPVSRPLFAVTPRGTLTRAAAALLEHMRSELASA